VGKYCRAGQATDDSMAHAHCLLDTYGYRHALRICNTYCFSTATMFTRTNLYVTLYVHCMSCLICVQWPFESYAVGECSKDYVKQSAELRKTVGRIDDTVSSSSYVIYCTVIKKVMDRLFYS
jgi:Pyruvate/2-oxoacid:ferredoxin oxidoreductase delta subunit